MSQFKKILKFELKYYFKNKIFLGTTILLVLIIAAVMSFPRISGFLEKSETETASSDTAAETKVMLVKAEDAEQTELVRSAFEAVFGNYAVHSTEDDVEMIKEKITSEENIECAFVLTGPVSYTYYVNNLSMYDTKTETVDEILREIYRTNAMISNGMTEEQVSAINNIQISSEIENLGKNQAENFFYTYIMIFALYFVIILYGQMVATNVATEKSSRAMEVLITSAKPTAMMFGKVLASCIAGFVQIVAVFGSALVFYNVNKSWWEGNMIIESIFNIPSRLLVYMLIFFVLGFLIYAFLFGAIGSTATKVEDINTSTMPLTILFVIAFLVVMLSMSSGDVDSTLMTICSYVPFTSPMAMFTRIAMSTVPMYEILISIAILIGSCIGIGVLSAKIYRVGVLLYGTTPKIGAIIKAVWKA